MRILLCILPPLVVASLGLSQQAAGTDGPLYARNLSPVAGLFGLPSMRDAAVGPAGSLDLALHSSIASHYVAEARGTELVNLDGETLRLALEARYALADNWDLQLEVPWLEHSGGNLDSLIDSWHSLWGMSDGGRSDVAQDLLDYRYQSQNPAAGEFFLDDGSSGLGDISLALSHQFYTTDSTAASVVLGYKFGTGEEEELLGSGAGDAYLAVRFSGDHLADLPLRWHGQLGYLRAGSADLLGDIQERDLWFGGLGLDWKVAPTWSLIAQVDAHGAPADSGVTALGDDTIMLTVGGRWRFSSRWALDVSLVEDVQVETAPDVTFQASLRYRGG